MATLNDIGYALRPRSAYFSGFSYHLLFLVSKLDELGSNNEITAQTDACLEYLDKSCNLEGVEKQEKR